MLSQFRKAETQPSVATYGKVVPSRPFYLRSASCRLKFEVLCKKLKVRSFRTSVGRQADFLRGAGTGAGADGWRCAAGAGKAAGAVDVYVAGADGRTLRRVSGG